MPPSSTTPDYYAVLEVAQGVSDQDINIAYRRLARIHHPDKNPGNEEAATAMFQKIQAAFETLSNPSKRQAYDWSYQPTPTTASNPPSLQRQYNWYTDPPVPPRQHNCCTNPHPSPPPRQYNRHTNPRPYNPDYDPDGSFDEVPEGWGRPDPPWTYHIPKPKPKNQSSPTSTLRPNNPPRATPSTWMPDNPRGAPEPWESAEDPALYGDPDAYWNPEARREAQAEHVARQREYEREVEEEWGGVGGGGDGGVFGPSPPPQPQPRPRSRSRAGDFPPQPQTFSPPAPDSGSGSGGGSVASGFGTRQNPIDRIPTPPPPPGTWGEEHFPGKAKHVYDPANPFQRGGCGGKR
ncbi:DnaJ-domain-containing protein [Xylariaceae sp. AK1471]|nr:DnaJ-domain-containing protein [Xylariaceae sp. AK1471]